VHRDDHRGAAVEAALPAGQFDVHGQQLDLRRETSWVLPLAEVSTVEAAEVLAINTLAPFVLNSRLKPLLCAAAARAAGPRFGPAPRGAVKHPQHFP
jgi:hypothetical protein